MKYFLRTFSKWSKLMPRINIADFLDFMMRLVDLHTFWIGNRKHVPMYKQN